MTYTPVDTMQPEHVGRRFKATIDGEECEGMVQFTGKSYYLCQDKIEGVDCGDKLGYNKSWSIQEGSVSDIPNNSVFNLVVETSSIKVGDKVRCKPGFIGEDAKLERGAGRGYEEGLEFVVDDIRDDNTNKKGRILFGGIGGNGVYEIAAELVSETEKQDSQLVNNFPLY